MKASELRRALRDAGFGDDKIDEIVKGRIESGGVEDDIGGVISEDEFDAALETLSEGLDGLRKSGGKPAPPPSDDDFVDVTDLMEGLQKSASTTQRAVQELGSRHDSLAKGLVAVGRLTEQLTKGIQHLVSQNHELATQVGGLSAALGSPVPPRSVTGLAVAEPSPGEKDAATVAKAAGERNRIIKAAMDEIQNPETADERKWDLGRAIADIDTHGNPSEVAEAYGIGL